MELRLQYRTANHQVNLVGTLLRLIKLIVCLLQYAILSQHIIEVSPSVVEAAFTTAHKTSFSVGRTDHSTKDTWCLGLAIIAIIYRVQPSITFEKYGSEYVWYTYRIGFWRIWIFLGVVCIRAWTESNECQTSHHDWKYLLFHICFLINYELLI